jgi:hypothetical protein
VRKGDFRQVEVVTAGISLRRRPARSMAAVVPPLSGVAMVFEILRHTPVWVYALFAYLVWMGLKRLQPSVRDMRRVYVVPAVFIVWGLSGLVQRADVLPHGGWNWLLGAVLGVALGAILQQRMQVDRRHRRVLQPASVVPLLRNLAIFGSHYLLNVAAAIHPRESVDYLGWDVIVSGLSAGYFVGWAIRFALAYRSSPQTDLDRTTLVAEPLRG